MKQILGMILLLFIYSTSWAGEADVVKARVEHTGDGNFTFHVTVRHGDSGWDHYANKWEVLSPDGKILGTRVLMHPHENEQPFTRSLGGIKIDPKIRQVSIRAHDSVHGYGGKTLKVALPN